MTHPTKNPWIPVGILAGVSVAAAIVLVWPSPSAVTDRGPAAAKARAARQETACRACEKQYCADVLNTCYPEEGKPATYPPPDKGGPATPEKQAGCREIYECFRKTGCANTNPGLCYCGEGVDHNQCFSGQASPHGPCKELVEKHAETKDPTKIGFRYSDPTFALGIGADLRLCDISFCKEACK